ncbi:MAG: NAD-dependent epimerase/dehydratase family protein [Streptococcaceae bacterium]|jgi:nucleoside-diphosphate-sugar epimerase|nr:NAD-dependent epimerase/dehydratase family protein [Streptococcaceae bacterium]
MKTVVITGGTGYIAHFAIQEFLEKDYAVRASVRTPEKGALLAESLGNPEHFSTFSADLTSAEGWGGGLKGVDALLHLASPLGGENVIDTAVNGTLNVLEAAHAAGVDRVILLSSQAAATGNDDTTGLLTEDFWANPAELDGYRLSKLKAEQAAWDFAKTHHMNLTTILPGTVLGPAASTHNISTNSILLSLLTGELPFTVNADFDTTNVRDLARLMRLALENDASIHQRYFAAGESIAMPEMARLLKEQYPEAKATDTVLDDATVAATPELSDFLPMMNRQYHYTTEKAERELSWKQAMPQETVLEAAASLKKEGLF